MKKFLFILMGIMALSLSSCEKNSRDYLAKTVWDGSIDSIVGDVPFGTLEFLGNGKVVWIGTNYNIAGTYTIIDDTNVSLNLSRGSYHLKKASVYVSTMTVTFDFEATSEHTEQHTATFKKR